MDVKGVKCVQSRRIDETPRIKGVKEGKSVKGVKRVQSQRIDRTPRIKDTQGISGEKGVKNVKCVCNVRKGCKKCGGRKVRTM